MHFPFTFYTATPAFHLVKSVAGEKRSDGRGKTYLVGPRTAIARVPISEASVPFSLTELTSDGQQVVVTGEARVRLVPERIVDRLDFSVDPWEDTYLAEEDPEQQAYEEVRHALRGIVRAEIRGKALKEAIAAAAELEDAVRAKIRADAQAFTDIGIAVSDFHVSDVAPANLDLKKALEAEARERMLANADKAVAERRMDAATNDRRLKDYEAETAEQLERKRAALIEARNANVLKEAEADRKATEDRLAAYSGTDAAKLLSLAMQEFAKAGKVGQLTITPDFLSAVAAAGTNGHKRS